MPNQWIIEEAFKNFIKELGLVKPYDIKIVISSFFYVENKAFEIMCEKMNLLCNLYRDYLLKIMDFKAES